MNRIENNSTRQDRKKFKKWRTFKSFSSLSFKMDKKVWNLRKNLKQVAKAAGFKSAHKFCCNERKRNCHLDDSCYSGTLPKKTLYLYHISILSIT